MMKFENDCENISFQVSVPLCPKVDKIIHYFINAINPKEHIPKALLNAAYQIRHKTVKYYDPARKFTTHFNHSRIVQNGVTKIILEEFLYTN